MIALVYVPVCLPSGFSKLATDIAQTLEHPLWSTINNSMLQIIKTFSTREGWWYIGIKGDGGVKSKGARLLIEKKK